MITSFLATAAIVVYAATLYPGMNRGLTLRTPIKFLSIYRQQIGIFSCLLACVHVVHILLFTDHTLSNTTSGVTCLTIFLLLGITSNHWSQKKLGKHWKTLHSLTYVLPLLLLWHIAGKMDTFSFFTRFNIFLMASAFSMIIYRMANKVRKGLHSSTQAWRWLRSLH